MDHGGGCCRVSLLGESSWTRRMHRDGVVVVIWCKEGGGSRTWPRWVTWPCCQACQIVVVLNGVVGVVVRNLQVNSS
jgi:hypothetical protein